MEGLSDGQLEQIAALVKPAKSETGTQKMPVEITACIPCYNALCWATGSLFVTLHSLEIGAQSLRVKLVLCDNASTDGTQLVLKAMAEKDPNDYSGGRIPDYIVRKFWLGRFPDGIQIAEPVPVNEEYPQGQSRMNAHMKVIHPRMLALVDTPYVLTVDSDVEVPRGSVRTMLDALKNDSELGMVGIIYEDCDHVQHGLRMMRTEDMRALNWGARGCTCRFLNDEVKRMGKKVLHLSPLSARHTKMERG